MPASDLHMTVLGSAGMKAAGRFAASGDDIERLLHGFSLFICLPDNISVAGSAATGTLPFGQDPWCSYRLHHNPHPPAERRARYG